jgi:predicted esterase
MRRFETADNSVALAINGINWNEVSIGMFMTSLLGTLSSLGTLLGGILAKLLNSGPNYPQQVIDTPQPRVFVINGITPDVLDGQDHPDDKDKSGWGKKFTEQLNDKGFTKVTNLKAAYRDKSAEWYYFGSEQLGDYRQVLDEYDQGKDGKWTKEAMQQIENQLAQNPLKPGEKIVLAGYSGGAAIMANLVEGLEAKYGKDSVSGYVAVGGVVADMNKAAGADKVLIIEGKDDWVARNTPIDLANIAADRQRVDEFKGKNAIKVEVGGGHTDYVSDDEAAKAVAKEFLPPKAE